MLDLKVFTYKYLFIKDKVTAEEIKEELVKLEKTNNQIKKNLIRLEKEYTKLKKINDKNCILDELKRNIDEHKYSINSIDAHIKKFDEILKSRRKIKGNIREITRAKIVDKVFDFKSDMNNYDIDAETNVFNDIKKYLETYPIKYKEKNLHEAFNLIQAIRRNKQLEEEITFFRNKNEKFKRFKEYIQTACFGDQKYYHFYSYNKKSSLYPYCRPAFEYLIANKVMTNDIEKELAKIFNKYNMCINLKLIFSDLFFHGMIPLERIATKPIELVDNDGYLSINIFDKMTVSDIKHFIEDNKNFFDNFRKEEKEFLKISQKSIVLFDLKHYAKKLSPGITRTYNKIYNEGITKDAVRQSNGRCKKRIDSIFYPKN